MDFADRPPSTTWETIPFPDAPGCSFWVWFRPSQAPQGLALRVRDETFHNHPQPQTLTLRRLLHAVGINATAVAAWTVYGAGYHGLQGLNPALDYAIPPPPPGAAPTIVVVLDAIPLPPLPASVAPVSQSAREPAYQRIEADWNASRLLEKQLTVARKRLSTMLVRINSLNRDLTADERRSADNRDNADWQDARRWLRDVAARLSRYLKDYDIGFTSAAGQRNLFEATYQQYIAPRRPFDAIEQMQRDFETYRKTLQTLMNNMHNALVLAERDGEQRAQTVLNRIAARAPARRTGRG